jgi:hypothetical protein
LSRVHLIGMGIRMASARFLDSVRRICAAACIDVPFIVVQDAVALELSGMRVLLMERDEARGDRLLFLCEFEHVRGAQLAGMMARLHRAYRLLGCTGIPCFSLHGVSRHLVMMGRLCTGPRSLRRLRALLGCTRRRERASGDRAACLARQEHRLAVNSAPG